MSRFRNISMTLCAAALAAAGVTSASADSADTAPASSPSRAAETTAVPVVQDNIMNNFALFRDRPATPMPAGVAEAIASPGKFGRNAGFARSIQTPYGTGWVIPDDGYMCIAIPDPVDGYGESCTSTDVALKQGLWVGLAGDTPSAKSLDSILVPDGATVTAPAAGASTTSGGPGLTNRVGQTADTRPTLK